MTRGQQIRDFVNTTLIRFADLSMESYDLLVINGLVVTASDIGHYDIAIKDEKIALLAPNGSLAELAAKRVIDAEGGYVMVCRAFPNVDNDMMPT